MSIYSELKRRNVFRVAIAYLAAAWLLSEVATTLFPLFGFGETPARIVVILLAIGFPLFLVFSWVFEFTPEGLRLEKDIDQTVSITHRTGKQLDRVIIVLLALALGYFAFDKFVLEPARDVVLVEKTAEQVRSDALIESHGDKSIAVLPFTDASADAQDAKVLAIGIQDDLLTSLSKISALRVISRTSVERYRNTEKSVSAIGRELGVAKILEGGVQRIGDEIRVNVQLIEAASDEHIWAETYHRRLTAGEVFAIQSEIVAEIVNQLETTLTPREATQLSIMPTESLAAYTAYLRGRKQTEIESVESMNRSVDFYKEAIQEDPRFALAYAGLAEAYLGLAAYFLGGLTDDESIALAEPPLMKALQLDGQSGHAYATLGFLRQLQGDVSSAEEAYQRAIALQPSYARTYRLYGRLRREQQRISEAVEYLKQAAALDPYSAAANKDLAVMQNVVGNFDEAMQLLLRVVEIEPNHAFAYVYIAAIYYLVHGDVDEALVWYKKAADNDTMSPSLQAAQALAYLELGDTNSARHWVEAGLRLGPDTFWPRWSSVLLNVYLGDGAAIQRDAHLLLRNFPRNWGALRVLRDMDLEEGRFDAARSRYARAYPELLETSALKVSRDNYWAAIDLALVLLRLGETNRTDDLLNGSLKAIRDVPRLGTSGYYIADVQIYSLQKRSDQALDALQRAIEEGWRFMAWYHLDRDPCLESIRGTQRFGQLRAIVNKDLEMQAQRVEELKDSGEL